MKNIPLTLGKSSIVDDEDFDILNKFKWHAVKSHGSDVYYANRDDCSLGKKNRKRIKMHRVVMNCPLGLEVDHINGDGLDNRKENLRVVTHQQNMANTSKRKTNKSPYKGVYWLSTSNKWRVKLKVQGRDVHIGMFTDIKEAAKAYNAAALKHFGEFAKLNEIIA